MDRFAKVFNEADRLILSDIYPASEAPIPGVTIEALKDSIENHMKSVSVSTEVEIKKTLEQMSERAVELSGEGDIIICLGAGSITKACEMILKRLG
jgi:UDP-N-acetylmuramate--alanine ligase